MKQNTDYVSSLAKGLAVISHLASVKSPQTLTEVADALEMPKATARRLLLTLESLGYAEQASRYFSLTPQTLQLGFGYFASSPLSSHIDTQLQRISSDTGHTSFAAVYSKGEITIIGRHVGLILESYSSLGTRWPAFCTSMGRIFLSYLPDDEVDRILREGRMTKFTSSTLTDIEKIKAEIRKVRKSGYALIESETTMGLRALAVPVEGKNQEIVAAIDVVMIAQSESRKESVDKNLPVLQEAASRLSVIAANSTSPSPI
ncbi:MAG: IclR family transcriptional regulator C-terminal domain-containing protein [Pseudomonadota bacterium]